MEFKTLGRTGLEISPIGFGGMELHRIDQQQTNFLVNTAIDNGINYIDTCPEYVNSEEFLGNALLHRRREIILATKCCDNVSGIGPKYVFDRKTCMENLEQSLRLLKTDYIDVWQIHGVIPEFLPGGEDNEVIHCMQEAKKAGKVRFIGLTIKNGNIKDEHFPADFGYNAVKVFSEWKSIDVIQLVYGGLTRKSENRIAAAAEKGVGLVARGVLKKYKDNYDELYEKANLTELFEEGESRHDFLLRFAHTCPGLACVLIGTKSPEHVVANIKAIERGALSPDVYEEAKRRLDAAGVIPGET